MSDNATLIIVASIAAAPPTLVAFISLRKVKETHLLVNSRMDELIKATKGLAMAEGREEGRTEKR